MEDPVHRDAEWSKTSKRRWTRVFVWAWAVRNTQISLENPQPSPPVWNCTGEMPDQEKGDLEIKSCSKALPTACCPDFSSSPSQIFTSPWQLLPGQDLEGCWHLVGLPCNHIVKSHTWFLIPRFAMARSVWCLLSWESVEELPPKRAGASSWQLSTSWVEGKCFATKCGWAAGQRLGGL